MATTPRVPVDQIERLEAALRRHETLWQIVGCLENIDLPDCWLVAGAVAQTVWNIALGRPAQSGIKDADVVYFDAEKLYGFFIKDLSQVGVIIWRQFALGVQSDFVEHSAEIEKATNFFCRTAQRKLGHRIKLSRFLRGSSV